MGMRGREREDLLHSVGGEKREARLSDSHHIGVISEDRESLIERERERERELRITYHKIHKHTQHMNANELKDTHTHTQYTYTHTHTCPARARAATWNTQGWSSPAILCMFGIINNNPDVSACEREIVCERERMCMCV